MKIRPLTPKLILGAALALVSSSMISCSEPPEERRPNGSFADMSADMSADTSADSALDMRNSSPDSGLDQGRVPGQDMMTPVDMSAPGVDQGRDAQADQSAPACPAQCPPERCEQATGRCLECSAASAATDCDGRSCVQGACTQTALRSAPLCRACRSDGECLDGLRCVPMQFQGDDIGGFCLGQKPSNARCPAPTQYSLTRRSVDDEQEQTYCGVDENATTCVALLDAIMGLPKECADDAGCGLADKPDGVCITYRDTKECSYPCPPNTASCAPFYQCAPVPQADREARPELSGVWTCQRTQRPR